MQLSIIAVLLAAVFFSSNDVFAQNEAQPTIWFDHASYFTKKMNCDYLATGKISPQDQEQTRATVIVTDHGANKFSTSIDRIAISVWSDSDPKGIEITAYETGVNSGIFNGTVTISEGQSTQGIIHVMDGDTISARYSGTTPWSPDTTNRGITATAFIGTLCPPLERVPASGIIVTDNEGNEQKTILAGKQILIRSNLTNVTIQNQTFAYIVQIQDKDGTIESLSWLSGVLPQSKTLSPSVSWTPPKAGNYTANIFVWQSIDNPNALSPPRPIDLTVWPASYARSAVRNAENLQCQSGYELVTRSGGNSTVCVTPDTAQKLIERGWARQGTYYRDIHVQPEITLNDYNYPGIDQDSNMTVSINNRTYYQTTLGYSAYKLPAATPIQFHNVTFTFPTGTFLTPGGAIIMLDIKFPDGYAETYGSHTANGGSGIPVPTPYGPHVAVNSTTVLSNHMRPQAGMTIYNGKIRLLVSTEGQSESVKLPATTQLPATAQLPTLCDTSYKPRENVITSLLPNGTHTITEYTPIFYMPLNSTGKLCVQYSNGNQPAHVGIRVFEANNIGKDSDTVTTSASQDAIPTGNSTVVYTINSGGKAGFYGASLFCGGQGLAIGYDNNSRIVLGDFPWYGQSFSCPALTYSYKITGLSNIGIHYITKTTREQIGYNITGLSVSSTHPTPTSQNVTFSFTVRTYNSGAHLWYDYSDSTLTKYFGDPGLKEESNPCTWDITNPHSLDNAQQFQFIGNAVVNDNPVTIPPYSNGTYVFSVIAKGLGPGIYRLDPVIFSESTDSKIPQDRLAGQGVAQNYPVTIGLDSNMDPSGICRW